MVNVGKGGVSKGKWVGGCLAVLVISGIGMVIVLVLFSGGRSIMSTLFRGNVYSVGYRDVYIQSISKKADTISGLGRVYELKASHHGYGAAVDPAKTGQTPQGAWAANFFDDGAFWKYQEFRGDTMCRVFYLEKDVQFTGASNYEVIEVIPLPPPGEPMDDLIQTSRELFSKYVEE